MSDEIRFYNYHEYVAESSGPGCGKVLVTDFPNPYVSERSQQYKTTRIVRVPRAYHKYDDGVKYDRSGVIPHFSEFFPGAEPGAIESLETDEHGAVYVMSSKSRLAELMSVEEYCEIVKTINRIVYEAYNPWRPYNVLYNVCGFVTGWLSEFVLAPPEAAGLKKLEDYVREVNLNLYPRGLKVVNPYESGFLSVGTF